MRTPRVPRAFVIAFALAVPMLVTSCGSSGSSNPLPPGTVLDQFTLNSGGSSLIPFGAESVQTRVLQLGQTFTVGLTGNLVGVDIIAGGSGSHLVLRIMPAPGGVIDPNNANALATVTILESNVAPPGFLRFVRLPGAGVPVTMGDELAITLEHPNGQGRCLESSSTYTRGTSFERDNENVPNWTERITQQDLFFGTYVAP